MQAMSSPHSNAIRWTSLSETIGRTGWEYGLAGLMASRIIKTFVFEKVDSISFTACCIGYGMATVSTTTAARLIFPPVENRERPRLMDQVVTIAIRVVALVSVSQIYHFTTGKRFAAQVLITFSLFGLSVFLDYIGYNLSKNLRD